ncbi:helix-turn-helix domain-containing protein [Dietzia alimentaria]|uniref:helix-turn-helix domain-containing protein n=1 Tax=Dietzia alimentaria TaxID=665550 RepID=UPI00029B5535
MEHYLTVSNTTPDQAVAMNIRAELARTGISQTAAARALGLADSSLSRRMNGRHSFRVSELYALADLIGVPVHAFIGAHSPVA